MDNYKVILRDRLQVQANPEVAKLSVRQRVRLMDQLLQQGPSPRGLNVTMRVSSSGKKVNGRIYRPSAHRAGRETWLNPYPKPLIKNHDKTTEPLGRFQRVAYDFDSSAGHFFNDPRELTALIRTLDTGSPTEIYDALDSAGVLHDSKWPGVGGLNGVVSVYDEDAVEKFLDGRYLTFSAGQRTDSFMCGLCGDDWVLGDICEHRPGEIYDGKPVVFITGRLVGEELSILNNPADAMSRVLSIEVLDSARSDFASIVETSDSAYKNDTDLFYLCDAEVAMKTFDLKEAFTRPVRVVAASLLEDKYDEFAPFPTRDEIERSAAVKMREALEFESRWAEKYFEDSEKALASQAQKVLDFLDEVLSDEDSTKEEPEKEEDDVADVDSLRDKLEQLAEKVAELSTKQVEDEVEEQTDETEKVDKAEAEEDAVVLSDTEKRLFHVAYSKLLGDIEEGAEPVTHVLDECVPVFNVDNLQLAQDLLEDWGCEDDKRTYLNDCINKAKQAFEGKCKCNGSCADIKDDYAEALKKIEKLEADKEKSSVALEKIVSDYASIRSVNFDDSDDLHSKLEKLSKIEDNQTETKPVENPGVSTKDPTKSQANEYIKKIANRYREILDNQGQMAAERFIDIKKSKGFLPRDFEIQDEKSE